jgi:hypothetical protein
MVSPNTDWRAMSWRQPFLGTRDAFHEIARPDRGLGLRLARSVQATEFVTNGGFEALMLMGFGGLGAVLRHRRSRTALAA